MADPRVARCSVVLGGLGLAWAVLLGPALVDWSGGAAGLLPRLPVAAADELTPAEVAEQTVRPSVRPLTQCEAVEVELADSARRVASGDALAADELAMVAAFLIEECGWNEGLVSSAAMEAVR